MSLFRFGLILIFAGFAVAFIAVLAIAIASILGAGEVRLTGGGCIIVAFIPICFGYGDPLILSILVVLAVALVVISYFIIREARKAVRDIGVEQGSWQPG